MVELPAQFHFLRPGWFLMLIPAALLLAVLWWRRLRQNGFERICEAALLPYLLLAEGRRSVRRPLALLGLAWFLATTALAGPVWEKQPQPVYRLEQSRVLVLDLSPSMAATDIQPTRLERARYKIEDILKKSREGRTALVVFSAEPHVVVPLTDDVATIASMLPALSVEIMPEFGDSAGKALESAASLLRQGGGQEGDIILLTDGIEDQASSLATAEKLRRQGVRLFVVGVGTPGGAPVPDPSGSGFVTDAGGAPRLAHFAAGPLRDLAAAGGGRYSTLSTDEQDIDAIIADGAGRRLKSGEADSRNIDRWQEEGSWLVLPLLLLALAGFRRGWLLCLLAALFLAPLPAGAMSWQGLWLRPDQQAAQQMARGNPAKAAELFEDPAWRAVAQHEAGRYEDAIATGKALSDGPGQYNLGNSLARAGRLDEALQAYDEALQANPDDADARFNRELVRKIIEQQQQEQQKDQADSSAGQGEKDQQEQGQQGSDGKEHESRGRQQADSAPSRQNEAESEDGRQDASADNPGNNTATQQPAKPGIKEEQRDDKAAAADIQQGQQDGDKEQQGAQSELNQAASERQQSQKDNPQAGQPPAGEQEGSAAVLPDNSELNVPAEKDLVLEQWLRQVPDDPSGLLRRKFLLEHQRRLQEKEP